MTISEIIKLWMIQSTAEQGLKNLGFSEGMERSRKDEHRVKEAQFSLPSSVRRDRSIAFCNLHDLVR